MKRKETEHNIQSAFVEWFRLQYPRIKIFAIPNGGARNTFVGKQLKKEGVLAGVPDLFIPEMHLWIEVKRNGKSKPRKNQKEMMNYLERVGYACIVVYGFKDAVSQVSDFIKSAKEAEVE